MAHRFLGIGARILPVSALVLPALFLSGCDGFGTPKPVAELQQGWTGSDFDGWAYAGQGSRLMPMDWFTALERPDGTGRFADPAYLDRFGFIPPAPGATSTLPVGFAQDVQPDDRFAVTKLRWFAGQGDREPWVGLNCAACHTGRIEDGDTRLTLPGAPGMTDYQAFVRALDQAIERTSADGARFDRFARAVLGEKDNPDNRGRLQQALASLLEWQRETARMNATASQFGFARVDAFGHIYNKVLLFANGPGAVGNPPGAPVSYPFLWDIWRQKQVQWNGVVENTPVRLNGGTLDFGALGRNSGEVIGVFGEVRIAPVSGLGDTFKGYASSLQIDNLDRLETQLRKLEAPKWPEAWGGGGVDAGARTQMIARGTALFGQHCASCHLPQEQWKKGEPIERMVTIRDMVEHDTPTDIWMACNAFTYGGTTGRMAGTRSGFISGQPYGSRANVVDMLATQVKGALGGKKQAILGVSASIFLGLDRSPIVFPRIGPSLRPTTPVNPREQLCLTTVSPLLAYKARPLNGIWATGPYLHNGSVPTLYHLLLPSDRRPRSFFVGSRQFDKVNVGFKWDTPDPMRSFEFRTEDAVGRPIAGNSNAGHEYGAAGFSDQDRRDLVEYMKTL